MTSLSKPIEITPDAIVKYRGTSVDDAILQAVYNSIDADATEIRLMIKDAQDGLFNAHDGAAVCEAFIVEDNGIGVEFERLEEFFLPFERSWKQGVTRTFQRPYHGSRGSGRFKYFAIGQILQWETTYKKGDLFFSYKMSLNLEDPTHLQYIEPSLTTRTTTGTTLTISKLTSKAIKFCTGEKIIDELVSGLILDLELSSNLAVFVQDEKIESTRLIEKRTMLSHPVEDTNGHVHNVECEIIAWIRGVQFTDHKHAFYYNSRNQYIDKKASGIPADTRMPLHTLIIKSSLFDNYSDFEANFSSIYYKIEKVFEADIISFLSEVRFANLSLQLNAIIKDDDYPFKGIPKNSIEDAIHTAYNAYLYSLLAENGSVISEKKPQIIKMVFPLLKRAFSGDYILTENVDSILQLPLEDAKKFNRMVGRIKLSKLIARYDKLRHRFDFLDVLEKLVHETVIADNLEERTQLHKIVAEEIWIFGKEYDNDDLVTSDRAIVTLIRQLNARDDYFFEDQNSDIAIAEAEKYIKANRNDLQSCLNKIPDLVLCKKVNNSNGDGFSYLIIELKKPSVLIDSSCRDQALKVYSAISQAANNHGGLEISSSHQWRYCLVSTGIADTLRHEFTANNHLEEKSSGNYVIDCLKWREIIDTARTWLNKEMNEINLQASEDECQELLKNYKARFGITTD